MTAEQVLTLLGTWKKKLQEQTDVAELLGTRIETLPPECKLQGKVEVGALLDDLDVDDDGPAPRRPILVIRIDGGGECTRDKRPAFCMVTVAGANDRYRLEASALATKGRGVPNASMLFQTQKIPGGKECTFLEVSYRGDDVCGGGKDEGSVRTKRLRELWSYRDGKLALARTFAVEDSKAGDGGSTTFKATLRWRSLGKGAAAKTVLIYEGTRWGGGSGVRKTGSALTVELAFYELDKRCELSPVDGDLLRGLEGGASLPRAIK
jgi:hypothetical protein